ncbi:quorum sensing histidine kinase QseC [Neisseria sp. Ec49-e6-T10]|uniref:quorum sensing histidine kinase QseC n=1 Tax=Neisseria sp. Ec49-e6-T10 TaxID=3140744 RepID=UPI003EBB7EF7
MRKLSLRLRLIVLISTMILFTWLVASSIAFFQTRQSLREVFDGEQLLFAKHLASPNLHKLLDNQDTYQLPKIKSKYIKSLELDDDALSYAVFSTEGKMLLNDGDNGRKINFSDQVLSLKGHSYLEDTKKWRVLWLLSEDRQFIVAVAQKRDYRDEIAWDILVDQMIPWVVMLPILILIIIMMISYEFLPFKKLANTLKDRRPDEDSLITELKTPKEVEPFVQALNALFIRIHEMLVRERRFISDAAHELRTPLAALKIQAEVALLAHDDQNMREKALNNLILGVDRATRLVDQMLILSRLDSLSDLAEIQEVNWSDLIEMGIHDVAHSAEQKQVQIVVNKIVEPMKIKGHTLLLSILVRNLLENAIKYNQNPEAKITITLDQTSLIIEDNGVGVSQEILNRLGERFFRPTGQNQNESGSGLGLSIVKQIAQLHGFQITFLSNQPIGFKVILNWS